jgi:hypothetical protein
MAAPPFRRYVPLLTHVLGWSILVFTFVLYGPLTRQGNMPWQWWVKQLVLVGMLVGVFYLNALVWVPRLLFRNRLGWFVLLNAGAVALVYLLHRQTDAWLNLSDVMDRFFHAGEPHRPFRPKPRGFNSIWDTLILLLTLFVLGISTSLTAVQKWQKDAQLRRDLEQARTSSELSFLKAQINPHFFFNTLNNIYALTMIDVDTAREALHRLSRMMRYVLYDTGADTVLLSQELAFVQDYIQLMQLRLTDKVTVTFEQPSLLQDVPIAPMLLLPFVENAFKHGVSATQPSRIYIGVAQRGDRLHIEVSNTNFPEKGPALEAGSGIGLANTRRRLDLLYPDRYTLDVQENRADNEFSVKLTLDVQRAEVDVLSV